MKEEVNTQNSGNNILYIRQHYPDISLEKIIAELNEEFDFFLESKEEENKDEIVPIALKHLESGKYWISNFFFDRFYNKIIEETKNPSIGYGMGREALQMRKLFYIIGPTLGMQKAVSKLPIWLTRWSRTKEVTIHENEKGHFRFSLDHYPEIRVSDFALDYHLGLFDRLGELATVVDFETQLSLVNREANSYEFTGDYPFEHLPKRYFNLAVSSIPHVKKGFESLRQKNIRMREEQKSIETGAENLKKHLSPEVVEASFSYPPPHLGVEKTFKSVMFTDIRNFTTLTERLKGSASELLEFYFSQLFPAIPNDAEINKMMGDGLMIIYDTPAESVSTGIKMRHAVRKLNDIASQRKFFEGLEIFPLQSGIGIASGEVYEGNIGTNSRMDHTIIGDIVNLASRLEGLTKEYHVPVIVDEETTRQIAQGKLSSEKNLSDRIQEIQDEIKQGKFYTREIDRVRVKGKEHPVTIAESMNHYSKAMLALKVLYGKKFSEALDLYYADETTTVSETIESLKTSLHLFKEIDKQFKKSYANLAPPREIKRVGHTGDYICEQKIEAIETLLEDMKLRPEQYEERAWDGVYTFSSK